MMAGRCSSSALVASMLTYGLRFAERELSYSEQKVALKNLIQPFLATLTDLGVETWLMHGSLLGWWWGKHVCYQLQAVIEKRSHTTDKVQNLPWDSDID